MTDRDTSRDVVAIRAVPRGFDSLIDVLKAHTIETPDIPSDVLAEISASLESVPLRAVIRAAMKDIADKSTYSATVWASVVRDKLLTLGHGPNCHVGDLEGEKDGSAKCVEWFAGQFLAVVDSKAWFAVNSMIYRLEKFAPEASP